MTIKMSRNLADILGFVSLEIQNMKSEVSHIVKGDNMANIHCGRNTVFLYLDILDHTPVGDCVVPLLKIIDLQDERTENGIVHRRTYDRPHYMPLRIHEFDTLEIDLRDDFGKFIPFVSGRTIVTLHFRQAKDSYFT